MVPILAAALLPLGAWLDLGGRAAWRLTWGLGILGALIQFPGVVLNYSVYIYYIRSEAPGNCIWTAEDMYKWHPRYSPLIGQWQRLFDSSTYVQRARPVAAQITSGQYSSAPQAWWKLLTDQGVSAWISASVVVVVVALALFLLAVLIRMAGSGADLPLAGSAGGDARASHEVVRYR